MEFKKVTLGEISINSRGYYGIGASAVDFDPELPTYLRITDINDDGSLNKDNLKSINEEDYEKYILKENDIVFARTGNSTGRNYFYEKKDGLLVFAGFLIKFSLDKEKVFPKYIKYVCQSKEYWGWINSIATGSTRKNINAKMYEKMPIFLPEEKTQEKIVTLLESLDSKIEINNKIISNLESQAQAIFKSWFVDFEPFQDGNFVESELGMIPEGWEVKPIGELLDFDIGGGWGKEKPQEKYLIPAYVIRGTDIPNSKLGYFNMDNYRYHTESNLKNRRLQVGDIIFESSGGSTNQDLGRMLLVTDELLNEYNNDIICASFCKLIRINDSSIRWFVYNLLEYSYRNKILTKYEVKSTGISNFSFTIFKDDFKIAVPNRKTMERYFNVTGNNINLSAKLGVQNTKLAELRDALLPKLMAGEIDVSNIKIEGEEVKNE